jgi:hypothetical protein
VLLLLLLLLLLLSWRLFCAKSTQETASLIA